MSHPKMLVRIGNGSWLEPQRELKSVWALPATKASVKLLYENPMVCSVEFMVGSDEELLNCTLNSITYVRLVRST